MPTYARILLAIATAMLLSATGFAQLAPPIADTFATIFNPRQNYGSQPLLVVTSNTKSYLKFDLSTVPHGASVTRATLRLYVDAVSANGKFDVYQLETAWSEGTLNFVNAPSLGLSATNDKPVAIGTSNLNNFVLIDVTTLVQSWLNGSVANNGIALALVGTNGAFSFDSKENPFTSHEPQLEIALAGAPGPQGPQGSQGLTGPQGPQGQNGLPGPAGAAGPAGPQGLQGLQGSVGPLGPAGPQGPAGPTGATGPAGPAGNAGTGLAETRAALGQWYSSTYSDPAGGLASPGALAFDGTYVWSANEGGASVSKIQAATGRVIGTYPVGNAPVAIVFDGTYLWVANKQDNTVMKLLPSTGVVQGTYPTGLGPTALVWDGTNVWVANQNDNTVTELNAASGGLVGTFAAGTFPYGLAFDGANIWVCGGTGVLTKLASSGASIGSYSPGLGGCYGITFDGINIWATDLQDNLVVKMRASDATVLGTYPVTGPYMITFDGTNIWVSNFYAGTVTKLLASTGAPLGTFSAGSFPLGLTFDGSNIWVANSAASTVTEIRATR